MADHAVQQTPPLREQWLSLPCLRFKAKASMASSNQKHIKCCCLGDNCFHNPRT